MLSELILFTILFYIIICLFGITIGSFLNVCIYRIPKKENIATTRSHCMECNTQLKWYDLVPLFSWLFLRGHPLAAGHKCTPSGSGAGLSPMRICLWIQSRKADHWRWFHCHAAHLPQSSAEGYCCQIHFHWICLFQVVLDASNLFPARIYLCGNQREVSHENFSSRHGYHRSDFVYCFYR